MWYITRRILTLAVWYWGPVLAALLVIFVASAQPKLGPPPEADPLHIYFSGWLPVFPGLWEFAIKKSAHIIAFGALTVLNLRALAGSGTGLRRSLLTAIGLTLAYALVDEAHQSFVPGRHASLADVGLDLIGAIAFGLVAWRDLSLRLNDRGTAPSLSCAPDA
jgi:hypothetical protein